MKSSKNPEARHPFASEHRPGRPAFQLPEEPAHLENWPGHPVSEVDAVELMTVNIKHKPPISEASSPLSMNQRSLVSG